MSLEAYKNILSETSLNNVTDLKDSIFVNLIKCAFIRNIEFNEFVSKPHSNEYYFLLPFLRGLAEDIISLNYIEKVIDENDRNDFIAYLMLEDVKKSTIRQNEYFIAERNAQPRVTEEILKMVHTDNSYESKIESLKIKYSWDRKTPTTYHMAEKSSLSEMYKYFYHATSRLVHFNPHLLMKLSWGECESLGNEKLKEAKFTVSTKNFNKYYEEFCKFYGSYLFIKFIDLFEKYLIISEDTEKQISDIRAIFSDNRRWPELITFEELNIPLKQGIRMFDLEDGGLEQMIGRMMFDLFENDKKET